MVILENVIGAPWQQIADRWTQHGYIATFTNMDAKHYYIPHTRTRKYLVAVRQGGPVKHTLEGRHKSREYGRTEKDCPDFEHFEEDWIDGIKMLQRPANPGKCSAASYPTYRVDHLDVNLGWLELGFSASPSCTPSQPATSAKFTTV